jgi:predicted transcriptional regulator
MNVGQLVGLRSSVYSIREDATVHEAAQYLRQKEVRAVGVMDATGRLIGVISQADVSDKIAAENKCPAWVRVHEVMSKNLVTVKPTAELDEAARLMDQHGFYHLLIVDDAGKYHGMLSATDLLKVIAVDEKERADLLQQYVSQS